MLWKSNSLVNVLKKEPYIIGHATFENNGIKLGQVICYEQGARTMALNSLKWTMQFHLVCSNWSPIFVCGGLTPMHQNESYFIEKPNEICDELNHVFYYCQNVMK
jgi:hypothetical protein